MKNFDKRLSTHIDETISIDLSNQKLVAIEFVDCIFDECNFYETSFMECKFVECQFKDCNLSLIKVNNSIFRDVSFNNSKIIGVNWTNASWPKIKLSCQLKFYSCLLNNSTFFGLNLREIELIECSAIDVDFRETNLSNANLMATDFSKSLFMCAI